ncbi:aldolase [Bacillus sp. FJAT-27225]|uniref:HpcH/HpaI aldolase family protein n=1 Tax=Bacillus sp. FJAT-27225 TaxID=1743144 RepID=UPI00080C3452|nr:aldolase/citrate lyase family protein [Bacillus sp. FJAT-27225]OCA81472.1 aldolase [Bacillus sp. FJAT-27225]
MFKNRLKANLANGDKKSHLSLFVGFPSIHVVEMAAYNHFDVVVIDCEHGNLSYENIEHMVIAAENAGITPLVRTVSSEPGEILKVLDRGAHGVHVPQVETKEQAERIIEAVKYPPIGKRGAAFSMRAAKYGTLPIEEYLEKANEETLVCVHIESEKAMQNLNEILQTPGIDLVYVGPTDLSVSLGYGGSIDHPEVLKAVDEIKKTAARYNVKIGVHTKNGLGAQNRSRWGADYIGITVSSLIIDSFNQYTSLARKEGVEI